MSYERDTDRHLKGVGAIAAAAGKAPRAALRRRQRIAADLKARDRAMSRMTMGPRGRTLAGLGAVKLPTFGRPGFKEAPVVSSGGVVEGGGTIGGGGAMNTGGTFGSGGGTWGGGGGPAPTVGGVRSVALNSLSTSLQQMSPPPYVGICVDASGNKIACPPAGGTGWNPNSGIVPPVLTGGTPIIHGGPLPPTQVPPSTTTTTTDPTTGATTTTTITGGGGGGGAGISTDPGGGDLNLTPPTDLTSSLNLSNMSTGTKVAIGLGLVGAAYLLFKKKGA